MGIISGITVYVVIWWAVLYMTLPWGSAPPESLQTGHATSAPAKPRFRQKFLITTITSAVLWLIVHYVVQHTAYIP